jgi:hypothetical protein
MKRFVITEEEKKHIMGLYEQPDASQPTQPTIPKKVIEVTDQSVIPQELVDSPGTPVGYFDSNKGTHDEKGKYMDITDANGTTYRFRNWGPMNFGGHSIKGVITAEYNSHLSTPQKTDNGQTVESYFEDGGWGSELVPNNKNKWMGFLSDDKKIRFVCFSDRSGTLTCKKQSYKIKQ